MKYKLLFEKLKNILSAKLGILLNNFCQNTTEMNPKLDNSFFTCKDDNISAKRSI